MSHPAWHSSRRTGPARSGCARPPSPDPVERERVERTARWEGEGRVVVECRIQRGIHHEELARPAQGAQDHLLQIPSSVSVLNELPGGRGKAVLSWNVASSVAFITKNWPGPLRVRKTTFS